MLPNENPFDNPMRRMLNNIQTDSDNMPHIEQKYIGEQGLLKVVIDVSGVSEENLDLSVDNSGRYIMLNIIQESEKGVNIQLKTQIPLKRKIDPTLGHEVYNNGIITLEYPVVDDFGVDVELR